MSSSTKRPIDAAMKNFDAFAPSAAPPLAAWDQLDESTLIKTVVYEQCAHFLATVLATVYKTPSGSRNTSQQLSVDVILNRLAIRRLDDAFDGRAYGLPRPRRPILL